MTTDRYDDHHVVLYIHPPLQQEVRSIALTEQRSISAMVRILLTEALQNRKETTG